MDLIHITDIENVSDHFEDLGLPEPSADYLPELWQFSFWAQRMLLRSLQPAITKGICPESAKVAKQYHNLVNDAVFFTPDVTQRVADLLETHLAHRQLGLTAANELSGRPVDFDNPGQCEAFTESLYRGLHFPVQSCLYLAHRARISVLKAAVDWVIAGGNKGGFHFGIPFSFRSAVDELADLESFRLLPTFWQVFLWGYGGFILLDREEEEYASLSRETGVPIDEIPGAITALDKFFPIDNGWLVEPNGSSRRVVKLMPTAMRGIGANSRLVRYGLEEYSELGYKDRTTQHLATDHNTLVRLLEADDTELVK